jgi:hypothetical protein
MLRRVHTRETWFQPKDRESKPYLSVGLCHPVARSKLLVENDRPRKQTSTRRGSSLSACLKSQLSGA